MRGLRDNALTIVFGAIFLVSVIGQSFAGQHDFNEEQVAHDGDPVSWLDYVLSSDFGRALLENWQSEYLQFVLFILFTIWLVQRGSNESKTPGREGLESYEDQLLGDYVRPDAPRWATARGWKLHLYSSSLLLVMVALFLGSWLGQSVTGWRAYNDVLRDHDRAPVSYGDYLLRPDFWESTLQNWQSEFLAVGSITIFTVYLRQRGSPESKPVGAPHGETASSG